MSKKKGRTGICDGHALKVIGSIQPAHDSAPIAKLQNEFLRRRFGVAPELAVIIAELAFQTGTMR